MSPISRADLILAGMAADEWAAFTPVQIQKLVFVLDRELSNTIGAERFSFQPYDYGPFDLDVYALLTDAVRKGFCTEQPVADARSRLYELTPAGRQAANTVLDRLDTEVRQYMQALSSWVRKQSFRQLVSAIYEHYPDMKVNSVFREG